MSLTLLEAAKAKLEGQRVEVCVQDDLWSEWDGLSWNNRWTHRIAPPPKVKYLCWNDGFVLHWCDERKGTPAGWTRVPEFDKEGKG